jgi:hypothetical protein
MVRKASLTVVVGVVVMSFRVMYMLTFIGSSPASRVVAFYENGSGNRSGNERAGIWDG